MPGETTPLCVIPAASLIKEKPQLIMKPPQVHSLRESTALHDAEELLLIHLTITITVGLINHLLELLIGHVLAEFLSHTLEVLEGDLASLIVVEETEHLDDLLAGVAVAHT